MTDILTKKQRNIGHIIRIWSSDGLSSICGYKHMWPSWECRKLKKVFVFWGFLKPFYIRNLTSGRKDGEVENENATPIDCCRTESLQLASQFKMVYRWIKLQGTQLLHDVAQHCSVLVFSREKFLYWKIREFTLRNKALAYLVYLLTSQDEWIVAWAPFISLLLTVALERTP